MKKSGNKIKNILKIGLLSLLVFPFLLGGVSYGADDLLYQLMEPSFNNQTVINAGENVSRVGQNFFKGSFKIDIDINRDIEILLDSNNNPLCGDLEPGNFLNGSLKSGNSTADLMTGNGWVGGIGGTEKYGSWLLGTFKSSDIVGTTEAGIFIKEKTCPDECKKVEGTAKSECIDEWIVIKDITGKLDASRKPSIIVKATRLLLMLVITLSVTMILYNGMMYIIQTGQGKEGKSLVKNIIYIVIGIILSLFSVIIITLIQSVPETLDADLKMDGGNSIDNDALE